MKIDFGSLSKIVVKPLPCRESALFVKGHDMKQAFTKFYFFFISSGFDAFINFIAESVQKYMKFFD